MSAHFAIRRTAASCVHPAGSVVWWAKTAWRTSRVLSAVVKVIVGRKRVRGNNGLSAAVPKTMGLRPSGITSSGIAARTPCYATATIAAGEETERVDLGVSSAGFIAERGGQV